MAIKQGFFNIAGFPNAIGAVDCTHVRVEPPSDQRNVYINRKGYPSLNCQMVCDHHRRFTNVVVKYPGSAHDSRIWRESALGNAMEANRWPNCILLGDSGYYQRVFLMTPYSNPQTEEEIAYNVAHTTTRSLIEQTFGILKRRFALLKTGTRVRSMGKAASEILACCLLHNYGIDEGDLMPAEERNEPDHPDGNQVFPSRGEGTDTAFGQAMRDQFAQSVHRHRRHRDI